MKQIMGYYCWIKQVDTEASLDSNPVTIRSGGTPPTKAAGRLGFSSIHSAKKEVDDVDQDTKLLSHAALGTAWMPDIAFAGDPKSLVEYYVVSGDREDALKFIRSPKGQLWRADAEQYFLLCFGVRGPQFIDPDDSGYQVLPASPSFGAFEDEWDEEFKREAYRSAYFTGRRWTAIDLREPIGHADSRDECNKVASYMGKWNDVERDARREHLSAWHTVMPVADAAELDPWKTGATLPSVIELIGRLVEETLPPLAYFKKKFNVARPTGAKGQCAGTKAYLSVPKHPAYPSGHAAQAKLVALALGDMELLKGHAKDMEKAYIGVADHRISAGLHYAMDRDAGFLLAEKLWALIKETDAYRGLKKLAESEIAQALQHAEQVGRKRTGV